MQPETSLKWLFLDLNSYFASVEQQENPALRGKPVAVVPMATDSTCAIAASYEAKLYGVKTGTKIYEAKQICPGLRCITASHDRYVAYHHRIIDEVIKHIPINKIWSIDELSSRLPPRQRNRIAIEALSRRIKNGIWQNIGSAINCSIGATPNGFLAKIATNMQKPDGLVILEPQDLPGRLFDLALTDLPGINIRMEARLARAGIRSVEQFWNLSPKQARHIWGSVAGERFWYNLHGFELPEPVTSPSVIGHSRVLEPALRNPGPAGQMARRLTVKAATRLRRQDFYATHFSLSVRTRTNLRWGSECRLSPAQDNFAFLKALEELWDTMLCALPDDPYLQFKKISISLHGLCRREQITPDLFDHSSQAAQICRHKNENLSRMMDQINSKYGAGTLSVGPPPASRSGDIGTKIAFSRIPDKAEFYE